MCGIVGGVGRDSPSADILNSQLKTILHRGPDELGIYVDRGVGLGMCRLAIVEIDAGKQPASDVQGKIQVVFNGEIYNYRELRTKLINCGVYFQNTSESEVIINLYLKFGLSFANQLNGMYAIAIYDARNNSLYLIRDRLGKKPLWYTIKSDGTLFFASETRALRQIRPDRTLRPEMIAEVLQYGYINSPNSSFQEIRQVPPASILKWNDGKFSVESYWIPDFETKVDISYQEAIQITKDLISEAVSRRLIAERPMGAFLSGGYDSTLVTAYMANLMETKVETYSIGFDNHKYDESLYSRKIARHLGTNHHEEILTSNIASDVEKLVQSLDQPFADSSIVPTYLLSKFARKDIVVAMGGDGGDEVFAGYNRYLAAPILQTFNSLLKINGRDKIVSKKQSSRKSRNWERFVSQLKSEQSLASRYSSILSLNQPNTISDILNPSFHSNLATDSFIQSFSEGNLSSLNRMIRSDFTSYLPGDLLVKADIATMSNSLELRSPLLDDNLVTWGLSLPQRYKIKGFETKHILKDITRSFVPAKLIERPKMGFAIPRADWLREGLKDLMIDTLTDNTAKQRGWFNNNEIQKNIRKHINGLDCDNILWPTLILELWARSWLD